MRKMKETHQCFQIEFAQLCVNPLSLHLGASPDGLVSCSGCGLGVLEIKCPFSGRHTIPTHAAHFEVKPEGVQLSQKYDYYFQVLGQAAILERRYCGFVCWTPVATHIERIDYDNRFVSTMIPKLEHFFLKAILSKVLVEPHQRNHPVIKNYIAFAEKESWKNDFP